MSPTFARFCAAGLWPELSKRAAGHLEAAGVTGPDDVTPAALAKVDGVSAKKAERLAKTFTDAQPRYRVAELIDPSGLPLRLAAAAVDVLGRDAAATLRRDPWRLLDCVAGNQLQPRDIDAFALRVLPDRPTKDDPRRGRALTVHVLSRATRDGHTVLPDQTVMSALAGLDVPAPEAAITAALDDGDVTDFPSHEPDGETPTRLLGLTR